MCNCSDSFWATLLFGLIWLPNIWAAVCVMIELAELAVVEAAGVAGGVGVLLAGLLEPLATPFCSMRTSLRC